MAANPLLRDWPGRVAWVVGASSGIGRATASLLHRRGAVVVVSARNELALQRFVAEHPGSHALALDVSQPGAAAQAAQRVQALHRRIDLTLYCAGHYQPMRAQDFNLDSVQRHLDVNYLGAARLLEGLLPLLRAQARQAPAGQAGPHLSLVGSVAGYRGLPNATAYGPSKAALQHLAETLYLDLRPEGLGVSIINPGFVSTPLTAQNDFDMPALITPEQAARHILDGWARGRFDIHFPRRFTAWLKLLQLLPHGLYVRAVRRVTGH